MTITSADQLILTGDACANQGNVIEYSSLQKRLLSLTMCFRFRFLLVHRISYSIANIDVPIGYW